MSRSSLRLPMVAAAVAGLLVAHTAAAQFRKPQDAIDYRRAAFTLMGTHFGRAAVMAYGRVPFDAKAVADNVELATLLSKLPYAGFVEGSDKGNTNALPKIWTEQDKFRAAAAKMQEEMVKLNAVAKTGNVDLIKAAVSDTDKACKACHEVYVKE